jgi:hypothetical protein
LGQITAILIESQLPFPFGHIDRKCKCCLLSTKGNCMKIYLLSAILKKNLPLSFNIEHKISLRFYKMYNLEHKCCGCLLRFPHGNDVRFLLPPVICRSAHVLFTLFVFVCGVQRMFNMMLCCGFFLRLVCRGPGGSMR